MSLTAAESAADSAAAEAAGWSALCDQYTLAVIRLELQLVETRGRCAVVEEESAHRVFTYNSLMFGITGQTARLARHFSTLVEDASAMQSAHDRMQAEKRERVNQIQEYHAQMILEHRSQAEAQAASFAGKIEQLRSDERDLRMRVSSLRQEAEESYSTLEKRRNDSLGERRRLEADLQRLQSEVSNQKYFLERLNAQVEASKMRLRETERSQSELAGVSAANAALAASSAAAADLSSASLQSRRISPPNISSTSANGLISQADRFSAQRMSPSPSRHGDSIASGIAQVQSVRDQGIDEQFVKFGRTAGTGSPQRAVAAYYQQQQQSYGGASATPRPAASTPIVASQQHQPVGLGSSHRFGPAAAYTTSTTTTPGGIIAGRSSPPPPVSSSSLQHGNTTPSNRAGVVLDHVQPSQWQVRLMKLQGELKSLKTDLGVQSPQQQQQHAPQSRLY
jgi:hypothetical protein